VNATNLYEKNIACMNHMKYIHDFDVIVIKNRVSSGKTFSVTACIYDLLQFLKVLV